MSGVRKTVIAKLSYAQSIRAPRVRKLATHDEPRENALLQHLIEVSKGGGGRGKGRLGDAAIYGPYRYVPL